MSAARNASSAFIFRWSQFIYSKMIASCVYNLKKRFANMTLKSMVKVTHA